MTGERSRKTETAQFNLAAYQEQLDILQQLLEKEDSQQSQQITS